MNKHMQWALVAMGLTLATTACDRGKAEAERKAAEAEKQAQEATLTAAKVQAEAEATTRMKAAHADARAKLQKEFDALDRKATYLKSKATKTAGTTRRNADAAIAELESRRMAAKASLTRLANDADSAWDATKRTAEDDIAAVGKSVESLDHTLMKK